METLCATGICVSELRYITVEAALAGRATITLNCDSPVTRQKGQGAISKHRIAQSRHFGLMLCDFFTG